MQYDPIQFIWTIEVIRRREYLHGGTSRQYACETSLGFSGQVGKGLAVSPRLTSSFFGCCVCLSLCDGTSRDCPFHEAIHARCVAIELFIICLWPQLIIGKACPPISWGTISCDHCIPPPSLWFGWSEDRNECHTVSNCHNYQASILVHKNSRLKQSVIDYF